jgi:hypothetical protein
MVRELQPQNEHEKKKKRERLIGKLFWNLSEDMLIIQQNSQEKAFCGLANDYI